MHQEHVDQLAELEKDDLMVNSFGRSKTANEQESADVRTSLIVFAFGQGRNRMLNPKTGAHLPDA